MDWSFCVVEFVKTRKRVVVPIEEIKRYNRKTGKYDLSCSTDKLESIMKNFAKENETLRIKHIEHDISYYDHVQAIRMTRTKEEGNTFLESSQSVGRGKRDKKRKVTHTPSTVVSRSGGRLLINPEPSEEMEQLKIVEKMKNKTKILAKRSNEDAIDEYISGEHNITETSEEPWWSNSEAIGTEAANLQSGTIERSVILSEGFLVVNREESESTVRRIEDSGIDSNPGAFDTVVQCDNRPEESHRTADKDERNDSDVEKQHAQVEIDESAEIVDPGSAQKNLVISQEESESTVRRIEDSVIDSNPGAFGTVVQWDNRTEKSHRPADKEERNDSEVEEQHTQVEGDENAEINDPGSAQKNLVISQEESESTVRRIEDSGIDSNPGAFDTVVQYDNRTEESHRTADEGERNDSDVEKQHTQVESDENAEIDDPGSAQKNLVISIEKPARPDIAEITDVDAYTTTPMREVTVPNRALNEDDPSSSNSSRDSPSYLMKPPALQTRRKRRPLPKRSRKEKGTRGDKHSSRRKTIAKPKVSSLLQKCVKHLKELVSVSKNEQRQRKDDSSDDSDVTLLKCLPEPDENGKVTLEDEGLKFDVDKCLLAVESSTMKKRLNHLTTALWPDTDRLKLVLKRTSDDDSCRLVRTEEVQGLLNACRTLQGMHRARFTEKLSVDVIRTWLSQKLKADRYRCKLTSGGNDPTSSSNDSLGAKNRRSRTDSNRGKKKGTKRRFIENSSEEHESDNLNTRAGCSIDGIARTEEDTLPSFPSKLNDAVSTIIPSQIAQCGTDVANILKPSAYKGVNFERSIDKNGFITWSELKQQLECTDDMLERICSKSCAIMINGKIRLSDWSHEITSVMKLCDWALKTRSIESGFTTENAKEHFVWSDVQQYVHYLFDKYCWPIDNGDENVNKLYRFDEKKITMLRLWSILSNGKELTLCDLVQTFRAGDVLDVNPATFKMVYDEICDIEENSSAIRVVVLKNNKCSLQPEVIIGNNFDRQFGPM